jgi:acetyltransferase-like isoleucine patch superfamily enzyme
MLIGNNVCYNLYFTIASIGWQWRFARGSHNLPSFDFAVNRSRSVMNLFDKAPVLGRNVFIAPNALVSGDVRVGNNSSVFYGSVVRGT